MSNSSKNNYCPACGSRNSEALEKIDVIQQHRSYSKDMIIQADLNEAMKETALEYNMKKCVSCGLEFASPLKAPASKWYDLAYNALDLYPGKRWEFGAVLRAVPAKARLMEMGCGAGAFLLLCREQNIPAAGMDFSSDAIAQCQKLGLDVRKLDVQENNITADGLRPDHITAFHVLEHLDDPCSLMEQASAMASTATSLWISVPSHRRATRWFGVRDFLDQPPHHMTRWTNSALASIALSSGWKLTDLHFEPLPLQSALWIIASNYPVYLALKKRRMFESKWIERLVRWSLFPFAFISRLSTHRGMTGFTMLARFIRNHNDPVK